MRGTFENVLNSLKKFWEKLTRGEKIRLVVLFLFIVALSIVIAAILGRTTYGVLYSGLTDTQAGEIYAAVQDMGVSAKMQGTDTILVPEDQVSEVRVRIASSGITSGGFTYDFFTSMDGWGTTDLQQQTMLRFQNEINLRETINTLDKVDDCLVSINPSSSSSFVISTKANAASAAITLQLNSGKSMSNSEARSIAEIVSASAGIPIENIKIVDTSGKLYSLDEDEFGVDGNLSAQYELRASVQDMLEGQVLNLLSPVVGAGNVYAEVSATLNFDKTYIESVEFSPPVEGETEGIVVSMSELYEYTRGSSTEGVVGTDSNGMGTVEYPYGDDNDLYYSLIQREINYEINEIVTSVEKAQGTISELSVAVIVNSDILASDAAETLIDLVSKAIGVNSNYVSVQFLPLQTSEDDFTSGIEAQNEILAQMEFNEILQLIIKLAFILLLAVLVLVLLRMVIRAFTRTEEPLLAEGSANIGGFEGGIDYVADEETEESLYQDIALGGKSEGIQQLERFIDKDSRAVAQLLRNWLEET